MSKLLNIIQTNGETAQCTEKDFPNFQRNGWKIVKKETQSKPKAKEVKEVKSAK